MLQSPAFPSFSLQDTRGADVEAFDRMFQALADANRRVMIERLCRGPATVTELAAPLLIGMPAVLKHLAVLEASAIVTSMKNGRVRTYRMVPNALAPAEGWIAERRPQLAQAETSAEPEVAASKARKA